MPTVRQVRYADYRLHPHVDDIIVEKNGMAVNVAFMALKDMLEDSPKIQGFINTADVLDEYVSGPEYDRVREALNKMIKPYADRYK